MNNHAVCRRNNLTLYIETDPRPMSGAKRPPLRLVEKGGRSQPTLAWRCQPWVYVLSMLPVLSIVYMMLDGFGLPVTRILGL